MDDPRHRAVPGRRPGALRRREARLTQRLELAATLVAGLAARMVGPTAGLEPRATRPSGPAPRADRSRPPG